jgi:hypothetical protein
VLGFIPNVEAIKAMLGSSVRIYTVALGKHVSVYQSFRYSECTGSLARPPDQRRVFRGDGANLVADVNDHPIVKLHAKIASIAQLGERQTEEVHPSGGPVFDSLSRHITFNLLSSLVPQTPSDQFNQSNGYGSILPYRTQFLPYAHSIRGLLLLYRYCALELRSKWPGNCTVVMFVVSLLSQMLPRTFRFETSPSTGGP